MDCYTIKDGPLSVTVTTECAAILTAIFHERHFLRPFRADVHDKLNPVCTGNFPMLPFCNRVEGNGFSFEGRDYQLERNTDWDPLYVHGDGWLSSWTLEEKTASKVVMSLSHKPKKGSPYSYRAIQEISVKEGILSLRLSLTNTLIDPLPFGFGHHLFFPKTAETLLKAKAEFYWSEKELFLPDQRLPIPKNMDFSSFCRIPGHWVNNDFEGWDGSAEIFWPEWSMGVCIEGDDKFHDYFLFHSDTDFEPNFKDDYFCFEPMTHTANGHHLRPDYGGLVRLRNGETFNGLLTIKPFVKEQISIDE